MLLYSAESVLKKVILSQFAVHLSSIFNYLNQCFLPADNNGTLSHGEFNAVAKGHFCYFLQNCWLKSFPPHEWKFKIVYFKNLLESSSGKVTLLGCCVLTANCMDSSLCAVYGGLPSSFSGLYCPNHSFFFQLPLPFYVSYFHSPVL